MEWNKWTKTIGTSGYVRVAQNANAQWWFLNAENEPFIARASAGVNRAGTTGGRLAKPGPYAETVDRLYDYPAAPKQFVDTEQARLRAWGFNAHGAWVTPEFFDQGMYYTDILDFRPRLGGVLLREFGIHHSDVYDPLFQEGVEAIAAEFCPPRRECRDFLGWFTDNEAGWGQRGLDHVWGGGDVLNAHDKHPALLQFALGMSEDRPIHRRAWDFVLEKYGDMGRIAHAWDFPFTDKTDFIARTRDGQFVNSASYGGDHHAFSVDFAETYFRITGEAIRRHDPNHLLMGCRFGAPPGAAISEACRKSPWVDVVSANNYRDDMYSRMSEYYQPLQKPLFIGEYAWCSDYHSLPGRDSGRLGEESLAPEKRIEIKGRAALESIFTHPGVVGYTWYRWIQKFEPESPWRSYSLVGTDDSPNPFHTRILSEVNQRAEAIRRGEIVPVTREELLARLG
jgi:hypothetical protein